MLVLWISCILVLTIYSSCIIPEINKILYPNLPNLSLGTYFLGGAICFLYKDFIQFRLTIWIFLLTVWVLVFKWAPFNEFISIPFFICSFLYFACGVRHIPFLNMDLSYGIYLYALPIGRSIQLLAGGKLSFIEFLLLSIGITTLFASASWFLIEKRALSLKKFLGKNKKG
jgi:hypothetical protein